ncbi:MAG: peptidyl-prolyl cis-trans isomerase [Candidatus Omnitrophica bacterium]|nr:peptidyl-prolyl cis-trans isomerase [Candidatus Omnitrophota bacterium]
MRRKNPSVTLVCVLSVLFLFLSGCEQVKKLKVPSKAKSWQTQGTVVAYVSDLPITLEQLEQEIRSYNESTDNPEAKINTREQKIAYLNEELIRRYLLYLGAKARGLDEQPKTRELLRNLEINVLASQILHDEIDNITVTSSEIEEFYNTFKDQYRQEEERRIREIVLDGETEAKDTLIELLKGADFAALAAQRSKAQSASGGGDLGFIKKGKRGGDYARFDEIAFSRSLEAGQLSTVFKEKNGYYIIKIEAIKGGQVRALSEVWDEIKKNVLFLKQQQKLKEITAGLLKKTKVVIHQDLIK